MPIEHYLVKINDIRRNLDGKLVFNLLVNKNSQGLYYTPSSETLQQLRDDFGIANDCDLIGRECTLEYKEIEEFPILLESNIQSIIPYVEYTKKDFAEAA